MSHCRLKNAKSASRSFSVTNELLVKCKLVFHWLVYWDWKFFGQHFFCSAPPLTKSKVSDSPVHLQIYQCVAYTIKSCSVVFGVTSRLSPPKTCVLDPLPTSILRDVVDTLLPFIWVMWCNNSLQEGCLPTSQKAAIITPVLKKPGADPDDPKNYRPILVGGLA